MLAPTSTTFRLWGIRCRYLSNTPPQKLRFSFGAGCVPKIPDSPGDDAFFASDELSAFGVADGVGSWASLGVDAGLFSRGLLRGVFNDLHRHLHGSKNADLLGALEHAYTEVRANQIRGSSTILLGQMHHDRLNLLNLGDCGVLVVRPVEMVERRQSMLRRLYRSTPMLRGLNFPHQLSSDDVDMSALAHHDYVTVRLRCGDIVVVGSDGLFDNISDREIESMLLAHVNDQRPLAKTATGSKTAQLAESITARAAEVARHPYEFAGVPSAVRGKLDDITVIVFEAQAGEPAPKGALLQNLQI